MTLQLFTNIGIHICHDKKTDITRCIRLLLTKNQYFVVEVNILNKRPTGLIR